MNQRKTGQPGGRGLVTSSVFRSQESTGVDPPPFSSLPLGHSVRSGRASESVLPDPLHRAGTGQGPE